MRISHENEKGLMTIEFAMLMVLLLMPLLFGVIDGTHVVNAGNGVERAAREGAIAASRGGDHAAAALLAMGGYGLDQDRATVSFMPGENYPSAGSPVTIRVNYDLTGVTILPWNVVWPTGISSEVTMRHE